MSLALCYNKYMSKKIHAPDYPFVITVGILTFFGIVVLTSASSVLGFEDHGDSFYFLKRQVMVGIIPGLIALIVLSKIEYQKWRKFTPWFLLATIGLLLIVFIPGLGLKLGGSRSWISVFGFSLQTSELAKLSLLLYLGAWLERMGDVLKSWKNGFFPFVLIVGSTIGLVLLQPDLGTVTVLSMAVFAAYFVAGAPYTHLGLLVTGGVAMFVMLIKIAPYRIARLTTFLNPGLDPLGIGYHINQALIAVGSGGVFGLGLGHSRQKFAYLPEVAGDSIFAIVAEELGFVFSLALVMLFAYLIYRGLRIAKYAPDMYGRILATGITVWLGVQAFLNIGAMVGVFPITGLPLPFISQGGTAILSALAGAGVVISISKQTGHSVKQKHTAKVVKRK